MAAQASAGNAAASQGAALAWGRDIRRHVSSRWIEPADTFGMQASVSLSIRPPGYIREMRVTQCNGSKQFCDSLIAALHKSEPFPRPSDPVLYDQQLKLIFEP